MANQNLHVNITGNASGLNNALGTAQNKLKAFGSKLTGAGAALTAISVPFVMAGKAGMNMSLEFDKSMTKIKALVGATAEDLKDFEDAAKRMSRETGVSATDAADALFFITSAGLEGAEAIETLENAMKASAAGLGETKVVADLATSAMNAYGSENLNSAMATDILAAAVREGKLESDQLAGSMGSVIPIASNMGVEFHEVGAALAAMSKTGTNAAVGATQLNAILMSLQKPSEDAKNKLAALGISFESLEKSVGEKGLMPTLVGLKGALEGTDVRLKDVFPNVRALKGVNDLLGASMESNIALFDELSDSAGATQEAFEEAEQSISHRYTVATNNASLAMQSLGDILLEAVVPIMEFFSKIILSVTNFLNKLPGPLKKLIAVFGLLVAALGPVLLILGGLITAFTTIAPLLPIIKAGFVAMRVAITAALGPVGLIITAIGMVGAAIYANFDKVKPIFINLYNRFVDLYNGSEGLRLGIFALKTAFYASFRIMKASVETLIHPFKMVYSLVKEAGKGFQADFSSVFDAGLEDGKNIFKDAMSDIADFATEGLDNLGTKLEYKVLEEVEEGMNNAEEKINNGDYNIVEPSDLIDENVSSPSSGGGSRVREVQKAVSNINISPMTITPIEVDTDEAIAKVVAIAPRITEEQAKLMQNAQIFNEELASITQGGLQDLAGGIGEALGRAMSGSASFGAGLKQVLLGTFGNMATQLGKLAIGIGTAVEGIKKALTDLNPFVAIAAGIALIALGKFASNQAAKIAQKPKATAFANGGIVSAPTLGLMGEYPGAKSNPEVIAPLDKLKTMIGNQNAQKVQVGGTFEIQGQDLVLALERANSTRNRIL